MFEFSGKALCFGDNINTDYIISSRRKKDTINPDELTKYIMEDIRPGFFSDIKGNCVLVAGENFGCGSAMEVAAQVVKSSGFSVVLAKSFARSFFRNAVNNGVLPVEIDTSEIQENDVISISMDSKQIEVTNSRTNKKKYCPAFSGKIGEILNAGGIIQYVQKMNS